MNVAVRPGVDLISLCTGGGGLDLGVELAIPGARAVCMVEREAFAVAHLVAAMEQGLLHPAPLWSDARTFDGRAWRGCVDGLIGGIPCQPHSEAGKRLGKQDERDLWSPTRRIIVQSQPWFVFIKNVRGMLFSGGFERVWRDLQRLGFTVEPGLFTAAEVGAQHERARLFILAVDDAGCPEWRPDAYARNFTDGPAAGRIEGAGRAAEPGPLVADAERDGRGERLGRPGVRAGESQPDGRRGDVADTASIGGERGFRQGRALKHRGVAADDGGDLVDASCIGWGEGQSKPSSGTGRWCSAVGAGAQVANAASDGCGARLERDLGAPGEGWRAFSSTSNREMEDAADGLRKLHAGQWRSGEASTVDRRAGLGLFAPGPSERDAWRDVLERAPELEPAIRRVADGVAADVGSRVDELRLLGNGVVPLEAAYAFRTLATRLAAAGSAGATRLVRMMEAAE